MSSIFKFLERFWAEFSWIKQFFLYSAVVYCNFTKENVTFINSNDDVH
jgi:hypothetical protein